MSEIRYGISHRKGSNYKIDIDIILWLLEAKTIHPGLANDAMSWLKSHQHILNKKIFDSVMEKISAKVAKPERKS